MYEALKRPFVGDPQGLCDNILRRGTPRRVYSIELFHDWEVRLAIAERFDLHPRLHRDDPDFARRNLIAVQRFCAMDYVRVGLVDQAWPLVRHATPDTASLARPQGRSFQDGSRGPIMSWADFARYPWPDPSAPSATRELEWYQAHLPDDMCIVGSGGFGHFCEYLTWLMGYETFCLALYDQPDLVHEMLDFIVDFCLKLWRKALETTPVSVRIDFSD